MQLCMFILLTLQYFIYCQNYIICVYLHIHPVRLNPHLYTCCKLQCYQSHQSHMLIPYVHVYTYIEFIKGYLLTQSLNHQ